MSFFKRVDVWSFIAGALLGFVTGAHAVKFDKYIQERRMKARPAQPPPTSGCTGAPCNEDSCLMAPKPTGTN